MAERSGVVGGARGGDLVKELVVVGAGFILVGLFHPSPHVPGEHLDLVQRGEVFDEVAADLPRAPAVRPIYAKAGGIGPALPVGAPSVANFPDTSTQGGGLNVLINPSSGINPSSPQFQATSNACQKLMP